MATGGEMVSRVLDARDLLCPLPVLKARKALKEMAAGEVLEVRATDPAAPMDFEVFCHTSGHRLLSSEAVDGTLVFRIAKAG